MTSKARMCYSCIVQLTTSYQFKLKCFEAIAKSQKTIPQVKVVENFFKEYGHQIISVVKDEDECETNVEDASPEPTEALLELPIEGRQEADSDENGGGGATGDVDHCYTKQEAIS